MFSFMSHYDAASSDEGRKVEYRGGEKTAHLLVGEKQGGSGGVQAVGKCITCAERVITRWNGRCTQVGEVDVAKREEF